MTIIIPGDCRRTLEQLDDRSVDAVVTSPPYLRQRHYGDNDVDEIGREDTVEEYLANLMSVFDHVKRILRPTGSVWINIGDKANDSGGAGGDWSTLGRTTKRTGSGPGRFRDDRFADGTFLDVPARFAGALVDRGWRLRLPIVWDKGREAPESLRHVGRPRWSHEMIYLFTPYRRPHRALDRGQRTKFYPSGLVETGSVWHFPPGGNGDPHLAPFPDELARRCILPSTLPGDTVLDPFSGSGTVPRVAEQLGRIGIGCELYAREEPS